MTTKLTTLQGLIFDSVKNHSSLTSIAFSVGKDKRNVFRTLKNLERKGFVFQNDQFWYQNKDMTTFDPPGAKMTTNMTTDMTTFSKPSDVPQSMVRRVLGRFHNVTVCIVHKESEFSWKRFRGLLIDVWVPSLGENVKFVFTGVGVQFHLKARILKGLGGVVELHRKCVVIANFLERRYKIRLVRPSDLGVRKLFSELAYLGTGWAESEVEKGRRIWLYNWKDDGKPRFLFDKSRSAEFESHGVMVDDDAIETAFFLEKLGNGEFREAYHNAEALYAFMPELMVILKGMGSELSVFGEGMRQHMVLIKEMQDATGALRDGFELLNARGVSLRPKDSVIDKIFKDDDLREKFEGASVGEKNRILGLKK